MSDFRDIVWCFSENSAVTREQLAGARKRIVYRRGNPDFEEASHKSRIIVLDDLLNDAYWRDVLDHFTNGSHQRNISLILIM